MIHFFFIYMFLLLLSLFRGVSQQVKKNVFGKLSGLFFRNFYFVEYYEGCFVTAGDRDLEFPCDYRYAILY